MSRDFPGSLVVKTSPSKVRTVSNSTLGRGAKIPYALGSKNQNIKKRKNTVTRSKNTKRKKKSPHQKKSLKTNCFK